jgi:hypothetical protein
MLDYSLAKQLKDAGFPGSASWYDDGNAIWSGTDTQTLAATFSELLKACGNTWTEEGLEAPARFSLSWDKYPDSAEDAWMATYFEVDGFPTGNVGYGETPEEAVARLWLVLDKSMTNEED